MKINLKQFSDTPDIINVDPGDATGDNPAVGVDNPPGDEPAPVVVVPVLEDSKTAATTTPMPSALSNEAWKNVEELLVTLSNNVRVGMADMKQVLKELVESGKATNEDVTRALQHLNSNMNDFKDILSDATVEVPEPPSGEGEGDTPPPKKQRGGHLSRRR